ncbi:MAG: DEAD/DEAH box helicase [Desulfomonilaceae bacterium]
MNGWTSCSDDSRKAGRPILHNSDQNTMPSDREILRMLGAAGDAFLGRFRCLTEVQRQAIPAIFSGKDVLIASATASGKTEAIVAPLVARLQRLKSSPEKGGVKFLIVAPTRALVNDLFNRVQWPLSEIGWTCGRQTSDHSDKGRKPHVLITTPESFDSMLCRDAMMNNREVCGHLLASVQAVFLDESHLYENTARGEHIVWLVARLRRLKRYAFQKGWIGSESMQICAGSATISHTSSLAQRLLGPCATVIRVEGDREMQLFSPGAPSKWAPVRSSDGLAPLQEFMESLLKRRGSWSDLIWQAIENGAQDGLRKVLIFVGSRQLCDLLSAELRAIFQKRRNIFVTGHHGSLDKSQREEAEKMFALCRDAVLVATSTLEVGIDIGDVDIVVLIGAPPDTSALLQRIGRGGRRSGLIKMIPIPQNALDCIAFSSMILDACRGILDAAPPSRRWGVFVQQIVSFIMQARGKGRKEKDILELVEAVWGNPALPTAKAVIDHLLAEEMLIQQRDRLFLGQEFSDGIEQNRSYFHCNFESEGPTTPVVDSLTGQQIAHIVQRSTRTERIAVAGMTVDVVYGAEEILVKQRKIRAKDSFGYGARQPLTSKSFAEHVKRGLGFGDHETVLCASPRGPIWFHFGGDLYERVLDRLFGQKSSGTVFQGLALGADIAEGDIRALPSRTYDIRSAVDEMKDSIAAYVGAGRFHKYLPDHVRTDVILSIFDLDGFIEWASSRTVTPAWPGSPAWSKIRRLFPDDAQKTPRL